MQLPRREEENEPINLLNIAKDAFNDVIYCHEGSSSHSTEEARFYLQMESKKWGGQLIEISTDSSSVSDGSILHLCKEQLAGASTSHEATCSAVSGINMNLLLFMVGIEI